MSKSKQRQMHQCGCDSCQRHPYSSIAREHSAINRVLATLDERNRRRFVGLLAIQWGPRSTTLLSRITGLSRMTVRRGKREIERRAPDNQGRIRESGGGRPPVEKNSRTFCRR